VRPSSLLRVSVAFAVAVPLLALLATSAAAVARKPAYGKPGSVQLKSIQGGWVGQAPDVKPEVIFPQHAIQRSPAARRDSQKICTVFQVLAPPTAPATTWAVVAHSPAFCKWIIPGNHEVIGNWIWADGKPGVSYHAQFIVTWSTKKKKKLARATYDFNTLNDYSCITTRCRISQGADMVPFLSFFA
jgi:hypothetical protein